MSPLSTNVARSLFRFSDITQKLTSGKIKVFLLLPLDSHCDDRFCKLCLRFTIIWWEEMKYLYEIKYQACLDGAGVSASGLGSEGPRFQSHPRLKLMTYDASVRQDSRLKTGARLTEARRTSACVLSSLRHEHRYAWARVDNTIILLIENYFVLGI